MRSMKLALASVATLAAVSLTSTAAHAESKSWGAIKKKVTAANTIVVSADFVPMRKLPAFDAAVNALVSMEGDVKGGLDLIKGKCSIDVTKVISDVTVVMNEKEEGAVAIGLDGLDQKTVEACLTTLATGEGKKLKSKKSGTQTVYSVEGEKEQLHLTWIGKDVVVISTDPMNPKALGKAVGKTGKSALNTIIAKAKTDAAVWFGVSFKESLPTGGTVTAAHGRVEIAGDKLTGTARITTGAASEATTFVQQAVPELQKESKKMQSKAPEFAAIFSNMTLKADGADVEANTSMPVKALDKVVQQLLSVAMPSPPPPSGTRKTP